MTQVSWLTAVNRVGGLDAKLTIFLILANWTRGFPWRTWIPDRTGLFPKLSKIRPHPHDPNISGLHVEYGDPRRSRAPHSSLLCILLTSSNCNLWAIVSKQSCPKLSFVSVHSNVVLSNSCILATKEFLLDTLYLLVFFRRRPNGILLFGEVMGSSNYHHQTP